MSKKEDVDKLLKKYTNSLTRSKKVKDAAQASRKE
jgi:hypothetical protein